MCLQLHIQLLSYSYCDCNCKLDAFIWASEFESLSVNCNWVVCGSIWGGVSANTLDHITR